MFQIRDTGSVRKGYWFAPRRYGFGAVPATKAGWAATMAYVLAVGVSLRLMPHNAGRIALVLCLTAAFLVLCWRKTDGGWRWRWGGRD